MLIAVAALAPPGLLMGTPFPKGLALLERRACPACPEPSRGEHSRRAPALVAWAWGVNGAVSVVASILAALLALSFGFSLVLALGAACYVGALAVSAIISAPRQ